MWMLLPWLLLPASFASTVEVDLQELVRQEDPATRRRRAIEIAGRKEVALEEWLVAMREFGRFEEQASGTRVERVALRVGDETELTSIHLHLPTSYYPARPAPLLLEFAKRFDRHFLPVAEVEVPGRR